MNGVKVKAKIKQPIKQHVVREYPHRGYCKKSVEPFPLLEFFVNLLGYSIVIGLIWYLITLL